MVEIEAIPDDTDDAVPKVEEDAVVVNMETWQDLMGEDLRLKILSTGSDENNEEKKGVLMSDKDPEPIEPQDAVLVEFEGFIAKDVDEAERFAKTLMASGSTDTKDDDDDDDKPRIFQQAKSWLVIVGDGDVLPALEMGIRFMQTGQTAVVWSHSKYTMGPGTRSYGGDAQSTTTTVIVPPRTAVAYKVKVIQKVMDTSRLNPYFTLQKAETKKKIANDIYQHEWCPPPTSPDDPDCSQAMARSIRLYTKAAKEMESLLDGTYFKQVEQDHPQRKQCEKILLDSLNNITAVYLRQKEYSKAKQSAVNVLSVDSSNLKALLRAAKASLLDPASSYEEVEAALKAADDEITYKNPQEEKDLKKLKVAFKKQQQQYKDRTKAMFGNKLSSSTSTATGTDTGTSSSTASEKPSSGTRGKRDKDVSETMDDNDGSDESPVVSKNKNEKVTDAGDEKSSSVVTSDGEDNVTVEKLSNAKSDDEVQLDKEDESAFWWSQLYAIIGQVVIPLILVLLYRYFYLGKTDTV